MLEKPPSRDPAIVADLCARWQNNHDEGARDELVRRFMPIIKSAARKWGSQYRVHPDDADQESALGFCRAIDRYDPAMGSLEHYTYIWARARISRARHAELPMTVPSYAFNDTPKVTRTAFRLRQRLGRRPTEEEIATEVRLPTYRVVAALAARNLHTIVVSIDTPISAAQDMTIGDTLEADGGERPDVVAEEASDIAAARAAIDKVVATFVPRHREVFRRRFIEGMNNEEIGARMGVIRQRVHQIEQKIIERLREALRDDPAVLALVGHEPTPVEVDDDSSPLLSTAEVEARTGIQRKAIVEMVGRGEFPRSATRDNRRQRLWREAAVERWLTASASPPSSQTLA